MDKQEAKMKKYSMTLGAILLVALLLIHTLIENLPVWVIALPGFLMGIDPREFISKK